MNGHLAIVGVGLIGGSFALALKAAGFEGEIVGAGRREEPLRKALQLGVIDRWCADPAAAAEGAGLVLLAVPMLAMPAVLQRIAPALPDAAVVTDAGSVKGSFVSAAAAALTHPERVVPGHPIAGTEHSGVEAAFATLYRGRRVILTPTEHTGAGPLALVRELWERTGAQVEVLDVREHDRLLAATSHLPHVLAFGLVDSLARQSEQERIFRYAAGGFRDFTRIASGDPVMWRDICITNREAVLEALRRFGADLERLTAMIDAGDTDAILAVFDNAKHARDAHVADLT